MEIIDYKGMISTTIFTVDLIIYIQYIGVDDIVVNV